MYQLTATPTLAQQSGSLIDKLLGLRELSWSDPSAGLGFEYVLPPWLWVLIGLSALLFAGLSYRRLLGSRPMRMVLALLRAVTLVTLAVLLAGPTLVLPQESIEQDWLMVMVDRSASMNVQDVVTGATGESISRDQSVREALQNQADVFSEEQLGKDRRLLWLGFGASAYTVGSPLAEPGLAEPEAQATSIRTAIEQALRLPSGKPISGVVLITDGQTPQDTGPTLVQRLQQQGVAVFPVPVGAAIPPLDLAIGQVNAPSRTFVNDSAPVSVTVEQLGGEPLNPAEINVALIDLADGEVLDEQTLDQAQPGQPLRLTGKPETVGTARWSVRVTHQPPPGQTPRRELVSENNTRTIELEVIDQPIRVLYVEGYPRWEFRYLKNLLIREKSISSSTYLLSADRSFAQEGDVPITRLPADANEMNAYDVVILGDVPPDYFNTGQLTALRDHVSAGGAGLIWLGGESHTPRSYNGTPLADLLPMRRPADVVRYGTSSSLFKLKPTPLAQSLSVMRMRDIGSGSAPQEDWPGALPPLRWMQDMGPLKPTAEVIAEGYEIESADELIPALVRLRYGAGQSLYVGTDEAWRWRYGRGEWYFEQYWVQLVRMLGRARIQADTDRADFHISSRNVAIQQPLVVELEIADPLLINRGLSRVGITVRRASDPAGQAIDSLELLPVMNREPVASGSPTRVMYRAVWRPTLAGALVLSVSEPALAELALVQSVRVTMPNDEMQNPRSDHARLRALAEQTAGAVVPLDELNRLVKLVPNRARITPTDIREPLWDSWLSMIVLMVLFSCEWVARRAIRLA